MLLLDELGYAQSYRHRQHGVVPRTLYIQYWDIHDSSWLVWWTRKRDAARTKYYYVLVHLCYIILGGEVIITSSSILLAHCMKVNTVICDLFGDFLLAQKPLKPRGDVVMWSIMMLAKRPHLVKKFIFKAGVTGVPSFCIACTLAISTSAEL